jgi:hypothetical protein
MSSINNISSWSKQNSGSYPILVMWTKLLKLLLDMDLAGITLRDIFYNHQDKDGNRLIDVIEKTSTVGMHHLLFQQSKAEEVDKMLEHIDDTLNSIGAWDECHTHFRYLPSMTISVVGHVPLTTKPAFWANHLS